MRAWCPGCATGRGPPTRPRRLIAGGPCDHGGMSTAVLAEDLRRVGLAAGLAAVGFTSVEPFTEARAAIDDRRAAGLDGGMQFTFRNPARSTEPERILAGARSLVVGAWRYDVAAPASPPGEPSGRVAAYARVDHYADLRQALAVVADHLEAVGHRTRVVADDNALADRAAALRAGIGWQGKNTNILLPGRGSWFVLGAVVTSADLPPATQPVVDGCGPCTRCLTGCPTDAIIAPGVLDARRCLAWLVQAPGEIPREHRVAMGDRLYGCDDCQEVCPPNRWLGHEVEPHMGPGGSRAWVPVLDLLDATDDEVMATAGRWYVPRRDPRFLRRNALVVLGNVGDRADPRVAAVVERYVRSDDDLLAAHAVWAARRLGLDQLVALAPAGPAVDAERNALAP